MGVNKSLPPATMNNTFPRQGPPATNAPADYVPIMDFNFNWSAPQIVLPGPEAQGSSAVGISNSPNSAAGGNGNITTSSPVGNANYSLVPLNLTVSPIAGNLGRRGHLNAIIENLFGYFQCKVFFSVFHKKNIPFQVSHQKRGLLIAEKKLSVIDFFHCFFFN